MKSQFCFIQMQSSEKVGPFLRRRFQERFQTVEFNFREIAVYYKADGWICWTLSWTNDTGLITIDSLLPDLLDAITSPRLG